MPLTEVQQDAILRWQAATIKGDLELARDIMLDIQRLDEALGRPSTFETWEAEKAAERERTKCPHCNGTGRIAE
jgi:hypothetical protein